MDVTEDYIIDKVIEEIHNMIPYQLRILIPKTAFQVFGKYYYSRIKNILTSNE